MFLRGGAMLPSHTHQTHQPHVFIGKNRIRISRPRAWVRGASLWWSDQQWKPFMSLVKRLSQADGRRWVSGHVGTCWLFSSHMLQLATEPEMSPWLALSSLVRDVLTCSWPLATASMSTMHVHDKYLYYICIIIYIIYISYIYSDIYRYRYRYRIDSVHFCPALHPSSLPWHGCPVSRGCHQAATSPRLGSPRRRWNIFCWSKHVKRVSKESPFCWLPALHPRASQDIQGTIHMSDGMELVKSKQCLLVLASGFSQERVDQKLSEAVTIDVTTGGHWCLPEPGLAWRRVANVHVHQSKVVNGFQAICADANRLQIYFLGPLELVVHEHASAQRCIQNEPVSRQNMKQGMANLVIIDLLPVGCWELIGWPLDYDTWWSDPNNSPSCETSASQLPKIS